MDADADARRLWFRHEVLPLEPALRAYARRFCHGGSDEVEDFVHETFARVIAYPNWQGVRNVPAFALRILKNIAISAARRRKIVSIDVFADLDMLDAVDDLPQADRVVEAREELRLVAMAIDELPPQCRKVFTLRKIHGLSHAQIAVQLGLSVSTVEKHITKGLRICSERLAKTPVGAGRADAPSDRTRRCSENE